MLSAEVCWPGPWTRLHHVADNWIACGVGAKIELQIHTGRTISTRELHRHDMPTQGPPQGALAGTYGGASGSIALGVGVGANVLLGGSGRSVMLQPISVEGSVGIEVTLGVSALTLQWMQ